MKKSLMILECALLLCCCSVFGYQITFSQNVSVLNLWQNNTVNISCGGFNYSITNTSSNFTNLLNWSVNVADGNGSVSCDALRGPIGNLTDTCTQVIGNLSNNCNNVVNLLNSSFRYYPLYADCYANLTVAMRLADDKTYYENKSRVCEGDLSSYKSSSDSCQQQINGVNGYVQQVKDLTKEKNSKTNQVYLAAIGGVVLGAGGYWFLKDRVKKGRSFVDRTGGPGEIRE